MGKNTTRSRFLKISAFDIQFNILGCTLKVSFPFLTLLTLLLLVDNNGTIVYGVFAALIHELGHISAMMIKNCRPQKISFRAFDINIIDRSRVKRNYNDDLFILAAGPLSNIIFCLVLYCIYKFGGCSWLVKPIYENIFIAVFNILPIESLDGGQIFFNLLCRRLSIKTATNFTVLISFMVLLPIAVVGFYILLVSRYNFSLLLLSCYLIGILLLKHKEFYY